MDKTELVGVEDTGGQKVRGCVLRVYVGLYEFHALCERDALSFSLL